jgi:hypothetical protein
MTVYSFSDGDEGDRGRGGREGGGRKGASACECPHTYIECSAAHGIWFVYEYLRAVEFVHHHRLSTSGYLTNRFYLLVHGRLLLN